MESAPTSRRPARKSQAARVDLKATRRKNIAARNPEDDPDAPVLITPRCLVEQHQMSKKKANRVAEAALRICAKRWPSADIRINDKKEAEVYKFISGGYTSEIPKSDVDMDVWSAVGFVLKAEISTYLLVRACEEAGVPCPDFAPAVTLDPREELVARWKQPDVPGEYHQLAQKTAQSAGLLAGLITFDRMLRHLPVPKARRAHFKKLLVVALDGFVRKLPALGRSGGTSLFDRDGQTLDMGLGGSEDANDLALQGVVAIASGDCYDAFARTYVAVLSGGT